MTNDICISFIIPSRNNLRYLKWAYNSIIKNRGSHTVQICIADDASTDGTSEWLSNIAKIDDRVEYIVNDSGERLGHTILYDRLVNEVAKYELCIIYHADMYLAPGALDAIASHMYGMEGAGESVWVNPIPNRIVSLTRIEPPLHPPGPEKILWTLNGSSILEPDEFDEDAFLDFHTDVLNEVRKSNRLTTTGIFAPWAFWKSEFQAIGGHDKLFAPQSKEDTDLFNRYHLRGTEFIQTWEGFVYHMTCRGSRRNTHDGAPDVFTNNPEWERQNLISSRNFVRKWGHFVQHDEYMKPIVPHKYDIGIVLTNANLALIDVLEPWTTVLYVDCDPTDYITAEQSKTLYNLSERVRWMDALSPDNHDVLIYIDGLAVTNADISAIQQVSSILGDSAEVGCTMSLLNMKFVINALNILDDELIVCEK